MTTASDDRDKKEGTNEVHIFWGTLTGLTLTLTLLLTLIQGRHRQSDSISTIDIMSNEEENDKRPHLYDVIDEDEGRIKEDVQWLLDYALVGNAKTGQTVHIKWLKTHEEVQIYDREIHALGEGNPAELVRLLYALPAGEYKRGYASFNDIGDPIALDMIRKYWPSTKLIIGLRHPTRWYESWYNHAASHRKDLPPAEEMVGRRFSKKACFHEHLALLGKTNVLNHDEAKLLDWSLSKQPIRLPNDVFLYESSQPFDSNETVSNAYRQDLSEFLGLSHPLDKLASQYTENDYKLAIDICDARYDELRMELLEMGAAAAEWIKRFFLIQSEVYVSLPDHFESLLSKWSIDPCIENGS